MISDFPAAVPEIPVSDINQAAENEFECGTFVCERATTNRLGIFGAKVVPEHYFGLRLSPGKTSIVCRHFQDLLPSGWEKDFAEK
jgi:hypothetical protein